MSTTARDPLTPVASPASPLPRWIWWTGGAALVVISGLASALVFRAPAPLAAAAGTGAQPALTTALPAAPDDGVRPPSAPAAPAPNTSVATAPPPARAPAPTVSRAAADLRAEVCTHCGRVESVRAIQKQGSGSGAGAVAGGLLGGLVGSQMGGGSGKTAITVLGAIGGGLAGNEVEKRVRAETVYEVRVRMDDGTERTLTFDRPPASQGERVTVEGQHVRPLQSGRPAT